MYHWLKEDMEENFYVISDDSDDVYVIGEGKPYKLKPTTHMFLKFKPYLEEIKATETGLEINEI